MKTRLKQLAQIQTGFYGKPVNQGELVYLQAKDFDESGQLIASLHPDLAAEGISDKHVLRSGDVLFAAKGTKNFATCYQHTMPPAVASTSFFVIRLLSDTVLPEYLRWFLNQPNAQQVLRRQALGTGIPSISKITLADLEIPLPPLRRQELIVNIHRLRSREKYLKQEIELLKEQQLQQQLFNAIR